MFFPPASFREVAGGQSWARKGMCMISAYRPPEELKDENGKPFADNCTQLHIQKIKPKGSGRKGMATLFYNIKEHRYYEDQYGFIYSHEKKVNPPDEIKLNWSELPEDINDEIAF
jgi:hypothetical protein